MTLKILKSRISVFELEVDLGSLASMSTREVPGFTPSLLGVLPTLRNHRCVTGRHGGFVEEMNKGTDFAHVLEHVIVELEHLADPDKRVYRGWTRRMEAEPACSVYLIHYEAKDFITGRLAAQMAVQLLRDLLSNQQVFVETIVHHLEDPQKFLGEVKPEVAAAGIHLQWASAKFASEEAELPTGEGGLIDLPAPTRSVLDGLSEQDKSAIRDSLMHLMPFLPEIHKHWQEKFSEYGGNYTEFIRQPIESIGLSPLIEALDSDRLGIHNETVARAGSQLARDQVPFSLVLHAVHLYEECLLWRLLKVYPDKEKLHNALVSLDGLFHNQLFTMSVAYFQQVEQERATGK